jgi:hypothetical protein
LHFQKFATLEYRLTYQSPKFLAGCHYNEEEISGHLKEKYRILAGPNEWHQVCNRSNPGKTGRSCEGADFSWLSSKVSQTLIQLWGSEPKAAEIQDQSHHPGVSTSALTLRKCHAKIQSWRQSSTPINLT